MNNTIIQRNAEKQNGDLMIITLLIEEAVMTPAFTLLYMQACGNA